MMRIIAGEFKSRIIKPPKGVDIRPTYDKVKEALFSILGDSVKDAVFLDLFAGSGNVGIEALSRGAKACFFVDNNKKCIDAIENNLKSLGLIDFEKRHVVFMETQKAIDRFEEQKICFDIIFMDPPYYKDIAKKTLNYISGCAILCRNAFLVVEHYKKDQLPKECGNLTLLKTRAYGDTVLSFFEVKND